MKVFVVCVLLCLSFTTLAFELPTRTLVGNWAVNNTCNNYCCCPQQSLVIQSDSSNISQVLIQASGWDNNPICKQLNLVSPSSHIAFPFSSAASIDDLQAVVGQQITGTNGIVYIIESISKQGLVTPTYNINLKVAQASVGGQICVFAIRSNSNSFLF